VRRVRTSAPPFTIATLAQPAGASGPNGPRQLYETPLAFCVGRGDGYYRGWRTPALAGTSALVLRCNLCDALPH